MRKRSWKFLCAVILTIACLPGLCYPQSGKPSFDISAKNVTMAADNSKTCFSNGECEYAYGAGMVTITSVDGYTGSPLLSCNAVNPPAGAVIPSCFQQGLTLQVSPGQPIQESLMLVPPGDPLPPEPASSALGKGMGGFALAGVLALGFGVRRRARWMARLLAAVAMVCACSAPSACGGGGNTMTPGTYTYSVVGQDNTTSTSANTTFTLTIS